MSRSDPVEPWSVELVTLAYSFVGTVDAAADKWANQSFTLQAGSSASPLTVVIDSIQPTSTTLPPDLRGRPASFRFGTGLIALAARNDAAIAVWERWNGSMTPLAGFALIGPYSLTGWFSSPDGTIGSTLMAPMFAVRDATLTRIDGEGPGFTTTMPRAVVSTALAHTIVATG
ncbi:MAG: hypothetical protein JWM34_2191 [Ilumatobacteraceae bacterium]|nr:hypothetical protein [Ilumatobacteraceae bacterium]